MSLNSYFDSLAQRLEGAANVRTVYGDPIEVEGRKVVPVSRIAYGFGGGPSKFEEAGGTTAGGGGYVRAEPVGVVEVTAEGTRFIPTVTWKKIATGVLVGVVLGWMMTRR